MKKILLLTDFSDGSFNALIYALNAANILGNSLEIINAYSMPPAASNVMKDITDVLKRNADEDMMKFRRRVEALPIANEVEKEYNTHFGSVVDVINKRGEDGDVNAVFMGTQGASGITEKWLGSNAASAARNVKIPLLAIPVDRPYQPIENILFSTDLKVMKHSECLTFVAKLAKKTGAEVRFFHVRTSEDTVDESVYKAQIKEYFDIKPTFSFTYNKDIEEGIENIISTEKPSILVVVRHEHGFFESIWHSSVSRHIINHASLPILVLNG
ncbi:MAG: universal stress protein [Flavobacteriales bacterium]|nr:universal stress protein [Flavobacteriales bacterium]